MTALLIFPLVLLMWLKSFTDVVDFLELRKLFIQFYPCVNEFDYFVKDLEESADLLVDESFRLRKKILWT